MLTNWKKTYSTWVNGAIAVLTAAATAIVWLSQQANTPIPLHVLLEVLAGVTAFTVFLRSLPQGEKPEPKPAVRVEERGWVPFYLLPWIALFAFVSLFLIACTRTPAEAAQREGCLVDATSRSNRRSDAECIQAGYAWDAEHKAKLIANAEVAGDEQAQREAEALELCPTKADIMAELTKSQEACR